jgi:guanylate cyclase
MWSSTPESSKALAFFAQTLLAFIARLPWFGRNLAQVFFRMVGSELLTDPKHAPATRPMFELRGARRVSSAGYARLVTSVRTLLDRTLSRLALVGADPSDDEDTRLLKGLLVLIAVLILPISLAWCALYVTFGGPIGYTALIDFAVSVASIVVFARTRDFGLLLRVQLVAILLTTNLSMIPLGGILGSAGVGLWGILAPLGALVFTGIRSGIRWYAAFLVIFLGSGIAGVLLRSESPLPLWFANTMLALNIAVGGTIVFTLLALFAKQRDDALLALRSEHERAENLLLNILPGSIAERLKASPQTIADQFDAASVLFADVVNFTPRSEQLSPAEVVGTLDRLFSHFDTLAERYGLEKIKTIGDAYMVAAGVPNQRPDHATVLASLALDMTASMAPDGAVGDLGMELRIGINTARSSPASSAGSGSSTTSGGTR